MNTPLQILHLEDNPLDAELIQSMLVREGVDCSITLTHSRETFVNAFSSKQFDVVICDYNLPGYDGTSALREIRQFNPTIPFIYVSGSIGEERAIESLKLGATDYILKDNVKRLPSALKRALKEAAELREKNAMFETLRVQEGFLHTVIDTTPVLITVKDRSGRYQLVNKAVEKFYGRPSSEILGKSEIDVNPNDKGLDQKLEDEKILFQGKQSILIPDDRMVHPVTGELHHLQTTKVPLMDSNGDAFQILTVSVDITERKKLEEDLLRSERIHNVGSLAGGIAHDLNNVLSPILLIIEVLRRRIKDESILKMLNALESSAKRGSALIKQVLSFARGTMGEQSSLDIATIVEEAEKLIKQTFPKSIKIQVALGPNLWKIFGDPTQIHQVVMNLCVNARDAMPNGGVINVEAKNIEIGHDYAVPIADIKDGKYVQLSVVDSGSGIEKEKVGKIFEPFFTTKELGKGTGLGLSTVKSIINSHSGYIDVSSIMGKGTTFAIYFPAYFKHTLDVVSEQIEGDLIEGNGETILVVDDEPAILEVAKTTLENANYRVLTANDGTEAVMAYFQNQDIITAVITDLVMPYMDGSMLINAIKKVNQDAKVIAMTGISDTRNVADQISGFGIEVLHKPFTAEQLLLTLHNVIVR